MKEPSIGQMTRLSGVSEQVLRFYDKVGLFSPMYRDREDRYRCYDIRQSAQLDIIQYMKAPGTSLENIREQMKRFDPDMLRSILYRNLDTIDQKVQELMHRRRAIEHALKNYEWYENALPDGIIVLGYIPRWLTYVTDSRINFYDYGIDAYEKILRELKKNLIANQPSPIYFYNVGTMMKKETLLAGRFYSMKIFVLVDKGFVKESLITQVPASTHLCIHCSNFDKEEDCTERLLEEIRIKEYRITGDYIYKAVAEVPMDMQERGMPLRPQASISLRVKDI